MFWIPLFLLHVYLLIAAIFKAYLCIISIPKTGKKYKYMIDNLPIYTVLIPLYKEANMVHKIVKSMDRLLYPKDKLQILILLEEDDKETIEAFRKTELPNNFTIIVVPDGKPRTKPRACNYALQFAKGELLVIYDGEDNPEADQLLKSVSMFRQLPKNYVCLQASLTYYNKDENWITKMFYCEYSMWFNFLIMGLARNKLPIPLGGTSNHFKIDALRGFGGWDPYCITEDCEIGLKIAAAGGEIGHLPSYTYEEAVNAPWAWIRQRTRWLSGYLYTFFRYAFKSKTIYEKKGLKAFLVVFIFIFGTPIFSLVTLPLYILFFSWMFFDPIWMRELFPYPFTWWISWVCLIFGNASIVGFHVYAVWRKGERMLSLWGLTLPIYWILHSVAALRAVWHYIFDRHSWSKTSHGKSKVEFNYGESISK